MFGEAKDVGSAGGRPLIALEAPPRVLTDMPGRGMSRMLAGPQSQHLHFRSVAHGVCGESRKLVVRGATGSQGMPENAVMRRLSLPSGCAKYRLDAGRALVRPWVGSPDLNATGHLTLEATERNIGRPPGRFRGLMPLQFVARGVRRTDGYVVHY